MPARNRLSPPWTPFNMMLARRHARLRRIIRKGLAPSGDKAALRLAAQDAVRSFNATRQEN